MTDRDAALMLAYGYIRPLPDGTYVMTDGGAAWTLDRLRRQAQSGA